MQYLGTGTTPYHTRCCCIIEKVSHETPMHCTQLSVCGGSAVFRVLKGTGSRGLWLPYFFYLEHSNYLGYEFKHTSTLLILVSKAEEDKNSNLCRITAGEESQSRIRLQDFKNALPVPYSIIIILIFYPRMLGRSTFSSFPFLISNTSIKKKHFFFFRSRKLDWEQIKFKEYSAEDCKKYWEHIQVLCVLCTASWSWIGFFVL